MDSEISTSSRILSGMIARCGSVPVSLIQLFQHASLPPAPWQSAGHRLTRSNPPYSLPNRARRNKVVAFLIITIALTIIIVIIYLIATRA
jgi:hypothetical protein